MPGAASDGRFFGVLFGVGKSALLRTAVVDDLGSILRGGSGVGRPRARAAEAAVSALRAPEIRLPLVIGEVFGVFLGAVGGEDEGEEFAGFLVGLGS